MKPATSSEKKKRYSESDTIYEDTLVSVKQCVCGIKFELWHK